MTFVQKINPINKEEEKKKFFFDPLYNPQFEYEEEITAQELLTYGEVSFEYFDQAKAILDKVISKFGSEEKYLELVEGRLLSQEELVSAINAYLQSLGLENSMTLKFSKEFIARTAVDKNEIHIRLPIEHREQSVQGVLNHEIGTHYLRNINEANQQWYKSHKKFGLMDHLETEEGLAVINFYYGMKEKYLWLQALYYYAACMGSKLSFSQLFQQLDKYVTNKERRWKVCLRVKRGMKDTSEPGAISKDQVYLRGVRKMCLWIDEHIEDLPALYSGKIAIEDLERLKPYINMESLALPRFLHKDEQKAYLSSMHKLMSTNFS